MIWKHKKNIIFKIILERKYIPMHKKRTALMNDFNFLVWIRLKRTGFVLISNQIKDVRCSFLLIMYGRWRKNLFKDYILLYGQAMPMDNSILRNIVGCYKNRNLSRLFSGDNLISKVLKKLFQVESVFK